MLDSRLNQQTHKTMKIHLCKIATNALGHSLSYPVCTKDVFMRGKFLHIVEFTEQFQKDQKSCCKKCSKIAKLVN